MVLRLSLRLRQMKRGYFFYPVEILALFVIYFSMARISLSFDAVSGFATLLWFPSGIAVASLLLFGTRLWPGIFLGAFLVNLVTGAPFFVAIGIGIGNTLEALVGAYLLKRNGHTFDKLRSVLALVLLVVPLSAFISATIGVSSLFLGKVITLSAYWPAWEAWWVGDMMSILILAPFILIWSKWPSEISVKQIVEIGIITVITFVASMIIFLRLLHAGQGSFSATYLAFPPLIWAALRFGPRGAITAVFASSSLAIVGIIQRIVFSQVDSLSDTLLLLQEFIAIIAVTTFILAAVMAERMAYERRKQESILALATTDTITTLLNQRSLIDRLDQELERARRDNYACSLLFLDLDHFKALNDGYGHAIGDAVLCEFADLVQARLRRIDIVGRWGGEEFVIILPELQVEGALSMAETVRTAVDTHTFCVAGIHLTCSIGLASYPMHTQEREGLLRIADQAMYGAKHCGRNKVCVANDPNMLALTASHGREECALIGTVEALTTLVEASDSSIGHHSNEVADMAFQLSLALELSLEEAHMIALAGRLHDVGKLVIPDSVLQKPGRLTDEEWEVMQTHTAVGADAVSHVPTLRPLASLIRSHHERWDGQGYPDHLAAEAIPLGARILTVVDAYQAMTMHRPYRQGRAPAVALAELCHGAGSQFDPRVVDVFRHIILDV